MPQEINSLIDRLEPIIGRSETEKIRHNYNVSRFNPTFRKVIEAGVRKLADDHKFDQQILITPLPKRSDVGGEYSIGQCRYGDLKLNARFGLRSHDFIKHSGLFGSTGSGKTTTAIQIIRQLCERDDPFLILDPKGTWQCIIRKPWAKDVKILRLGSSYAPYTFNPFQPLEDQNKDTLLADVVEVFCDSQYLGFGAKSLLQQACYSAGKDLTMRSVYEAFRQLDTKGYKKSQWADSTERALKTATTGILGKVLNSPDNIPFDKLMGSKVVILMDSIGSDPDQVSLFNGMMLNRIYWFRKIAGVKELFKHLLVFEEFHVMANAEFSKGEGRIESMVRMCREFSQGVMIIDQNPGKISDAVLGNLNTVITMNLGNSRDINAVGTAMALEADHKRYLGRLSVGEAICKVKDRLKDPVLVKIDAPDEVRKIEPSPEEIKAHNGDFVPEIPEEIMGSKPKRMQEVLSGIKLTPIQRKILRITKINNGVNLSSIFKDHLGVNYGRGGRLIKPLEAGDFIRIDRNVSTPTGKENRIFITEKGREHLKNTYDARRLGGKWHRKAVDIVAAYYQAKGFFVRLEYRDVDVFVDMGTETVAVEVEALLSGRGADIAQAISNALKASKIANRIEMVVRNKTSGEKLIKALIFSPLKSYNGLTIRLLDEYK
jgi:DNA-binding MarR family transcriptional regulator